MTEQNDDDRHSALDAQQAAEDARRQDRDTTPVSDETAPYVSRCIVCGKPGDQHPDRRWCGSEQYVTGDWTDIPIVADVARAIGSAFHRGDDAWTTEALAAVAAARPHLTGPLVAEIEQLRAGYASCTYLLPYGHEDAQTCDQPCHPSTDRCLQHEQRHLDYIAGLTGEITCLKDSLAGRDVNDRGLVEEVARLRAELAAVDRDLVYRLAAGDRSWSDETGDEPSSPDYIRHLVETATALRETPAPGPAAETPAPADEDEIDEFHPDYCPAELAFDNRHSPEYFKRGFLCAWCHADPDAVPATAPATTTGDQT